MRTILHSLAWKEWHEHKWKLASIVAILWATAALALYYGERDGFGMATVMVCFCLAPLATFVGIGSAANERSRGTMAFLQALPAPMWPIALAKLICGLLTLILSVLLTLPLLFGWSRWIDLNAGSIESHYVSRPHLTGNIYVDAALLWVALAASLYIWSSAAGVNRKDEVGAGAVALATMVGWYAVIVALLYLLVQWHEPPPTSIEESLIISGLSTAPAGFVYAGAILWEHPQDFSAVDWFRSLLILLVPAVTVHMALAIWYVRRFGLTANSEVRSPQVAVRHSSRTDWLSSPRQSVITAIIWKQLRECGPLVLAGLAGVVGITLVVFGFNPRWFLTRPGEFAGMVWVVGMCIGFAITLIVGIGVCFYDVSPQQNTFWRSRPINPDAWYWVRFLTGLFILVATLSIPLFVIVLALHPNPDNFLPRNATATLLLAQMALFSAAVATTCLVRQAVYSAILSIPLLYSGVIVMWIALRAADNVGWINDGPSRLVDMSYEQLGLGFLLTFVVCTVLGWLAMRYDWGRKSRY